MSFVMMAACGIGGRRVDAGKLKTSELGTEITVLPLPHHIGTA